ncbi:hypothetical protein BDZ45DRAFT_811024 [Acephala macrosclerotiorum]|nr:hypothetical protein BDZ45DRAFT_811024 [Acephala macrosclerotiorum]
MSYYHYHDTKDINLLQDFRENFRKPHDPKDNPMYRYSIESVEKALGLKPGEVREYIYEPPASEFEVVASFEPSNPNQIVTFIISTGEGEKSFVVHEEVACLHSPVLRAAFTGSFEEAKTKVYKLDDVGQQEFELLMQWLDSYKGKFPPFAPLEEQRKRYTRGGLAPLLEKLAIRQESLVHLWVLAERFQILTLCNQITDILEEIRNRWRTLLPASLAGYVYENTAPIDIENMQTVRHAYGDFNSSNTSYGGSWGRKKGGCGGSPLRLLMLDHIIVSRLEERDGKVELEDLPKEVLVDVVKKLEWNAGMAGCTWGVSGGGLVLERKYYFEVKTEGVEDGKGKGKVRDVGVVGEAGSSKSGA